MLIVFVKLAALKMDYYCPCARILFCSSLKVVEFALYVLTFVLLLKDKLLIKANLYMGLKFCANSQLYEGVERPRCFYFIIYTYELGIILIYRYKLGIRLIYSYQLGIILIYSYKLGIILIYSYKLGIRLIYSCKLGIRLIYTYKLGIILIYSY